MSPKSWSILGVPEEFHYLPIGFIIRHSLQNVTYKTHQNKTNERKLEGIEHPLLEINFTLDFHDVRYWTNNNRRHKLFQSHHVQEVVEIRDSGGGFIHGKVTPQTRVNNRPYDVKVEVNLDRTVRRTECTYKAGLSVRAIPLLRYPRASFLFWIEDLKLPALVQCGSGTVKDHRRLSSTIQRPPVVTTAVTTTGPTAERADIELVV
ncbi:hypothetical protein EVAR_43466_1 [Eumeta japonica]|uniref:Uncharacterized protein n=1 Tax=Eumeta variegata TaxID=151549 RepID=A0A4C1Z3H8_EUMVA|nr:hypothetical protein EVAR_43466_1 [Eumeta japonica]